MKIPHSKVLKTMSFQKNMITISKKIDSLLTVQKVAMVALLSNLASIAFGVAFIAYQEYNALWDVFGVVLLFTIYWDLLEAFYLGAKINKNKGLGRKLNFLCYIFLATMVLAMIGIMLGNLLISARYSNQNLVLYAIVYGWYFGILAFGAIISLIALKLKSNGSIWGINGTPAVAKSRSEKIVKKVLKIFTLLMLLISAYLGATIAFGSYFDILFVPAALAGQFGVFFSFIFLSNALIFLKLRGKSRKPQRYYAFALIGIIASTLLIFPLLASPYTYYAAEANFKEAFGPYEIDDEIEAKYFLKTPFTTPEYFLGAAPKGCNVEENVKFYEDDEIKLYFDVYAPKDDPKDLPGKGSTLIRIHGGAWVMNDKGAGDMLQMNKYFAAQGYIVFDIQYAQYDMGLPMPNTPKYLLGDFTLDEIVASLGYFTKYLTKHADEYDANLNKVFVSGGSAGGHLTCALALGIASGKYKSMFGDNLTIKGLVPYYPASHMQKYFGINVKDKDLANPENLIDKNSPPCLIFQGTHDILTRFNIAQGIKDKYAEEGNEECALIWMSMGGHACDAYYSGYYNQIFLYFMERFLYLCVEGEIQ